LATRVALGRVAKTKGHRFPGAPFDFCVGPWA
jgi:hypothetical protein